MQQLISSYLFQNKNCPLPGLGTLFITPGTAQNDFVNKVITAPVPSVAFTTTETEADKLVDFIAAKNNSSALGAIDVLGKYCNNLKAAINNNNSAAIDEVGFFFTDTSGSILFAPSAIPQVFLPKVDAGRVIHPEAEHNILVGDKETTNMQMAEYYNETPPSKNYWWVWAIILGIAGIIAIAIYSNGTEFSSLFGNSSPAK